MSYYHVSYRKWVSQHNREENFTPQPLTLVGLLILMINMLRLLGCVLRHCMLLAFGAACFSLKVLLDLRHWLQRLQDRPGPTEELPATLVALLDEEVVNFLERELVGLGITMRVSVS